MPEEPQAIWDQAPGQAVWDKPVSTGAVWDTPAIKTPKKLAPPPSLPGSKNFPDVVVPGLTKPEPEPDMIEVQGEWVPNPASQPGAKQSKWNPIDSTSQYKPTDTTDSIDKVKALLLASKEKNQPWNRIGVTKEAWDAMPLADRLLAIGKNAGKSIVDQAKQAQTMPIRLASGIGRGVVGLTQAALENSPVQLKDVFPMGNPGSDDTGTTNQTLSKDLGDTQASIGRWMDTHGLNPQPQTTEGEIMRGGSDVIGDLSLMGLVPGKTFATKGTGLAALLGGRAGGQTFNEGTAADLPLEKKNVAAAGEAALNAGMVAIPASHAAEGMLGLESTASKLPLGALEGWGMGQMSNTVREKAGLPVDNSLLSQLVAAGQGAGMKGVQGSLNPTKTFNDLPRFTGETPVAEQMQGQTVGGLERLLASAPDRRLGSQAIARNYFDVLGQHPDEVMREVRDYHDAQVAGTKPPTISAEAKAVLDSPAWKQLMEDQSTLRNRLQVARGLEEDANPHHIPRVITGGVETSAPGNANKMRTGTNSDLARSLFAVENPDGTRSIVSKDSPEAQDRTLLPATSAEIEAQTPIGVRNNPVQSVIDNNIQMQTALDNRAIINQINSSKFASPKGEAPEGFLPLEGAAKKAVDPNGDNVYDPRVKTMIEKSLADHADPNILDNLNRGIVQFGFANPTVHTPNVINHGYLSGMLKIASSPKVAMEAQDRASDAVNSVMEGRPNADAIEVMRAGGRMMVPDQINARNAESRANGEPSVNQQARDEAFGNTNDQFKVGKEGGALDAIGAMNQKYTWSTDSKARLFNYFLHQAKTGGSLADSIHEVDRAVYPNYRQTYNEMEGTGAIPQLANAAGNMGYNTPGVSLFGSYNKAATKIATLMVKDLGPAPETVPDKLAWQRRQDAASHVASTVIGLGLIYPALGKALQGIEGTDQEKEAFIGGSAHKTQLFLKAVEDKDWRAASRIAGININPVVALGAQANGLAVIQGRTANSRDLQDAQSFALNGDTKTSLKAAANWAGDAAKTAAGVINFSVPALTDVATGKADAKSKILDMLTRGKNIGTDAEKLYNRFYSDKAPTSKASWDKVDEEDARKAMGKAIKDQDFSALGSVISSGSINPDLVEKTIEKLNMPKEFQLAAKAKGLSFEDQIRLWRVSTPKEQQAMLALGLGDEIMKHADPSNPIPTKLMNTKAFIDNWVATRKAQE